MVMYIGIGVFIACLFNNLKLLVAIIGVMLVIWKLSENISDRKRYIILLVMIGILALAYFQKLESIGLAILSLITVIIGGYLTKRLKIIEKNHSSFITEGNKFVEVMEKECSDETQISIDAWLAHQISEYMKETK